MDDLVALRAFSPVAARLIDGDATFAHALAQAPEPTRLQQLTSDDVRRGLRRFRRELVVHTAAAELSGVSPLLTAQRWSQFADVALVVADTMAAREIEPRCGTIDTGRTVLGLGKLGSNELNPSSDIDIVCVYGDDVALSSTGMSAHEWHTHHARRLRAILADVTDDGFAFRVDFDLRPEGTRGPLVNSVDATEAYYERFGRVWERVALLRLRPSVDVGGVGQQVVARLRPFVFRRSFDPRVVDELFAMKAQLTTTAERDVGGGFDVKRGRGGIREVEFMAQSLVLLHAGRIPALRTLQAQPVTALLQALEAHGLLPFRTARDLVDDYTFLRRVEHAIQLGEDRQTQVLPAEGDERARVRAGVERATGADFEQALLDVTARVSEAFHRHLGESRHEAAVVVQVALDLDEDDATRAAALVQAGFTDAPRAAALLSHLQRRRGGPFSATQRSDPRVRRFTERMLEHIGQSVDPMAALERLVDVFPGRAHPALLERLADDRSVSVVTRMLALSAPLSRALGRLAHLGRIDDALLFALDARRPSTMRLLQVMRASNDPLAAADDEVAVSHIWRAKQEALFSAALPFLARVTEGGTARQLDVTAAVIDAQRRLSIVAEACVQRALEVAFRRLRRRHGALPGLRFSVCALGSLGGRELGFFRDLDLAFVYDVHDSEAVSDGARPITAAEFATRLGQQVLWVLTSPTAADPLYPVDTRLRPSGNQGALTTSLSRFREYHAQESALWERQSLLRLRPIAGEAQLGRDVVAVARAALSRVRPVAVGAQLLDMRQRMIVERARTGIDLKLGAGGICDIEFAVQGLQLATAAADPGLLVTSTRRALARLSRRGHLPAGEAAALRSGLDQLVRVRELLHLVDDHKDAVLGHNDDRLRMLCAAGVLPDRDGAAAAEARLLETMRVIDDVSHRVLQRLT